MVHRNERVPSYSGVVGDFRLSGVVLVVAAAVPGLLVMFSLLTLAVSFSRRRAMARRLSMVLARLDVPGAAEEGDREDSMSRLERLAESAVLRVSEAEAAAQRMAETLKELGLGVVICDEQGTVVYRNAVAAGLAGVSPDNLETEEAVTEVLEAGLGGERLSCSVELLGPPQRTLSVSGRPLDDGRRTLGAVALVEDLSERRRFEMVRYDFVDNITAELKTPLAALGLLATTVAAEKDPKLVRRLAERLRDDAVRAGTIVDDLSEFSRISAEAVPERQLVPVQLVVAQAVEETRALSALRSITVEVADAPRRATVVGSRRQLVSAVRRLLENAVTFSKEGSAVRVAVHRRGAWVEIAVTDQGPGIPESEMHRIFESFYRVAPNGSRDSAGTGLGLAIASQVASGHGGDVQVESTPGEGSTFTLRLPVRSDARHRRARVRARRALQSVSDAAS